MTMQGEAFTMQAFGCMDGIYGRAAQGVCVSDIEMASD